jgi:hypothetical protein
METENNKTPKRAPSSSQPFNYTDTPGYSINLSFFSLVCLPHYILNTFQLVERMWTALKWNGR